ncbi:hypothetical protein ADUPG1_004670, partial [Aduncisulcus paluster]
MDCIRIDSEVLRYLKKAGLPLVEPKVPEALEAYDVYSQDGITV